MTGEPNVARAAQFAVSISKKVGNTAVLRNRTRRRVYNALRELAPQVRPGIFVGFAVKTGGEKLEFVEIGPEVRHLLKRAGLLLQ